MEVNKCRKNIVQRISQKDDSNRACSRVCTGSSVYKLVTDNFDVDKAVEYLHTIFNYFIRKNFNSWIKIWKSQTFYSDPKACHTFSIKLKFVDSLVIPSVNISSLRKSRTKWNLCDVGCYPWKLMMTYLWCDDSLIRKAPEHKRRAEWWAASKICNADCLVETYTSQP